MKLERNGKHGCFDVPGVAAHEALHAAGFSHEHQRTDRNQYLVVHFENIPAKSNNITYGLYMTVKHFNIVC
jgi:hypothetical protein